MIFTLGLPTSVTSLVTSSMTYVKKNMRGLYIFWSFGERFYSDCIACVRESDDQNDFFSGKGSPNQFFWAIDCWTPPPHWAATSWIQVFKPHILLIKSLQSDVGARERRKMSIFFCSPMYKMLTIPFNWKSMSLAGVLHLPVIWQEAIIPLQIEGLLAIWYVTVWLPITYHLSASPQQPISHIYLYFCEPPHPHSQRHHNSSI